MNNLNEKEKEMNNLDDKLGLQGKYRTIVHRAATGKVETSEWKVNTINTSLKEKVNDVLLVNSDFALDNLFSGNATPPTNGFDGIYLFDGADEYQMDCSSSEPTSTSIKITGTFTGTANTFESATLGWNYQTGTSTVYFATPTSWDNVILAAADTLTVEWTITVGA